MLPLKTELENRWFIKQFTSEDLFALSDKGWISFYFGVDPSADSMTIGNFVALMQAIHVMLRWNKCYLLVWWATGMIGNPTGKDAERNFLDEEALTRNQAWIRKNFEDLCINIEKISGTKLEYEIVNNYDWFKNMNYLQFLREVGKSMTVNWMMNKDIVKSRINDPDKFISYAEFSYMLIMGYDYYVLARDHNVVLEVGGSDEWDGILAGIEITSKLLDKKVHGLTNNLILDSNGRKFGKSEWNAIWLDPKKSTPYFVYQYFLNVTDEDVNRFLRLFTLLTMEEIDAIVAEHSQQPQLRIGQKTLAYRVVQIIHGTEAAEQAQAITDFVFASDKLDRIKSTDQSFVTALVEQIGGVQATDGDSILDVLVNSWFTESRGDAKKLIQQNGISLNEVAVSDINYAIRSSDRVSGVILLQKGKKNMRLVVR